MPWTLSRRRVLSNGTYGQERGILSFGKNKEEKRRRRIACDRSRLALARSLQKTLYMADGGLHLAKISTDFEDCGIEQK